MFRPLALALVTLIAGSLGQVTAQVRRWASTTLQVQVTTPGDLPHEGATVRLSYTSLFEGVVLTEGRTDERGQCRLRVPPGANLQWSAESKRGDSTYGEFKTPGNGEGALAITHGAHGGAVFRGVIVDTTTGAPIDGAEVEYRWDIGQSSGGSVPLSSMEAPIVSKTDGSFAISMPSIGVHHLCIHAEGYAIGYALVRGHREAAGPAPRERLQLARECRLTLRLEGAPPGLRLHITSPMQPIGGLARAGSEQLRIRFDGSAVFPTSRDKDPDLHAVEGLAPAGHVSVRIMDGASLVSALEPIPTGAPGTHTERTLDFRTRGIIAGTLHGESGAPLPNRFVSIASVDQGEEPAEATSRSPLGSTFTGEDGTFTFEGVYLGNYIVYVSDARRPGADRGLVTAPVRGTLTPDQLRCEVALTEAKGTFVTGVLLASDGEPLRGRVKAQSSAFLRRGDTDRLGKFRVGPFPRGSMVRLNGLPAAHLAGGPHPETTAQSPSRGVQLLLSKVGHVSGQIVHFPAHTAPSDALVHLRGIKGSPSEGIHRRAFASSMGHFKITGLPIGTYRLVAHISPSAHTEEVEVTVHEHERLRGVKLAFPE